MRRIATLTAALNLFGAGKNGFRASALGIRPTQFSNTWCNDVQETLMHPIEAAGLVAGADFDQLTQAILVLSNTGVVTELSANTNLTRAQRGLVLVNASAGNVVLTLPAADAIMDFMFKRVDSSVNKVTVVVKTAPDEAIFHNTEINSDGYPFIRLFGKGDYWCLKCDANGGWHPVARGTPAPIGSLLKMTGTHIPSGGWGKPNGTVYLRADFPWLWDMAGVSGNLYTEAEWAANRSGGYSTGDTATTMRVLEIRGEFIRVYDDGRGVDAGRVMGAPQGDAIRNITGTVGHWPAYFEDRPQDASGAFYYQSNGTGTPPNVGGSSGRGYVKFDASLQVPTAGENRPRGLAYPHLFKLI